ncbi:MAG: hypothetical protein AB3N18_12890 [Allomuricauda sp.]
MVQRKKYWVICFLLGIILFSGFMVQRMASGETNNAIVNLIMEKDSKTYLYSYLGESIVQNNIEKGESPSTFVFAHIYEEDNKLYIAPDKLKEIVSLLCGDYKLYDYREKNADGYVTSGNSLCFETSFKNQSTEKIGEQIRINTVQLVNQHTDKTFTIEWHTNMRTNRSVNHVNCYKKSFKIKTSVQPGEFVISSKDFIMVDIQDVVDFYGGRVIVELNKKDQFLYVRYK